MLFYLSALRHIQVSHTPHPCSSLSLSCSTGLLEGQAVEPWVPLIYVFFSRISRNTGQQSTVTLPFAGRYFVQNAFHRKFGIACLLEVQSILREPNKKCWKQTGGLWSELCQMLLEKQRKLPFCKTLLQKEELPARATPHEFFG
jgi:hypothetical protein